MIWNWCYWLARLVNKTSGGMLTADQHILLQSFWKPRSYQQLDHVPQNRDQLYFVRNFDQCTRIVEIFLGKQHRESNAKLSRQLFSTSPNKYAASLSCMLRATSYIAIHCNTSSCHFYKHTVNRSNDTVSECVGFNVPVDT